jgi:circadian clock protein KaiB
MSSEHDATLRRFEDNLRNLEAADYVLTLFVTGASDRSVRAISNLRNLCEGHLKGRYQLEVVDINRDPESMISQNVIAAPTLIKEAPLPRRRLVGDLSDTERVLAALDIKVVEAPPGSGPGG